MEKGWKATGLLSPLWARLDGGREALAALTGIRATELSSYNSGAKNLGISNARRIADALEISVLDLGAPEGAAETRRELRVVDRLRAVEAALNRLGPNLEDLGDRVTALERQVPSRKRRGTKT